MSEGAITGPKVRFIGIGMPKAGTTWLWKVLRQHPDLFLPERKELQYFNEFLPEDPDVANPNHSRPTEWYEAHFEGAGAGQICGEISPIYWLAKDAASAIAAYNPSARLIATLRDPVGQMQSAYLWRSRRGTIGRASFEEALGSYPVLWDNVRYAENMKRFLDCFPREQIIALRFDDIKQRPKETLGKVQDYLEVTRRELAESGKAANTAAAAAHPGLARLYQRARITAKKYGFEGALQTVRELGAAQAIKRMTEKSRPISEKPTVGAETRLRILDFAGPQLEALGAMLGQDYSDWCKAEDS